MILGVVTILFFVIIVSGCTQTTNQTSNKTYDVNGISFNYPSSWEIANVSYYGLLVVLDPTSNNETRVFIGKYPIKSNETLNIIADQVEGIESKRQGFVAVSRENITIAGVPAVKITHKDSINERTNKTESQREEFAIVFMKNGFWYEIQYTTPPDQFNKNLANFNMILDTLKIN